MQNFVVSSRKYRPGTFDAVVGQSHITETLKNALRNNHLAHAFLFCGPRGVGKTTNARILAKVINCQNLGPNTEPCNECDSCKSFDSGSSFNIFELDAASNNSVEDIRGLVEQVRYPPQGVKYKVYIIDEVHMLSTAAFNAFLKTLEEPPPYAIFILATTERHKILPTILSRCQIFNFNRIKVEDCVAYLKEICLKEGVQAEEEALHVIAQKSDGAMRDALTIFDQIVSYAGNNITYRSVADNLNILDYDYYFKITDACIGQNVPQCLVMYDEILDKGFDGHMFINGLSEHLRNLLVCRDTETIKLLEVADSIANLYAQQSKIASTTFLINALNICNQADIQFKASRNQRLLVELMLIKLSHINTLVDIKKNFELNPAPDETTVTAQSKELVPAYAFKTPIVSPRVNLGGMSAIDKIKQKIIDNGNATPGGEDQPEAEVKIEVITLQMLDSVLADFKLQLDTKNKKMLLNVLDTFQFSVGENNFININIPGNHNISLIEESKPDLSQLFFDKYMIRPQFNILAIASRDTQQYYFTNQERFRKLAEGRPYLLDLAKRLDLRFD
ncbi:MAG: DNA polymerase III subunit gamma/tau [Bacteroidota bacterium]|nr:DNA polymerase III subunit gamma/tau [Bacteroidota bacterium]